MKPIKLKQKFNNIPSETVFVNYQTSPDMFSESKNNYIVQFKGKDVVIPGELFITSPDEKV